MISHGYSKVPELFIETENGYSNVSKLWLKIVTLKF